MAEKEELREFVQRAAREHKWRNADWKIEPKQDGTFSPDDMTNALLVDIRALLGTIKAIMVFFTVLTVIGLVLGLLIGVYQVLTNVL